jgi:NAD(P)-dependent dehydrogenase (short-subunit alcohol dehydrogenase family)
MASKEEQKLLGKVALITGGSRGIGKAVATAYAREGAGVFICARKEADVQKAVAEIESFGARAYGCSGDVGKIEDAQRMVQRAAAQFSRVDILVNNASLLGPRVPIANYPVATWEEVLRVNLTGPFLMIQEALKIMIPQRQGSIINVSSGVGRIGKARWGAYAASKFGVEGLTQVVADEVREFGIRANAVNPGPTRTEMRLSPIRKRTTDTAGSGSDCSRLCLSSLGRLRGCYRPVIGCPRLAKARALTRELLFYK